MVPLRTITRAWGRIGCLGFGGPPVHVAMLRELCVERERWIAEDEFEDAIAFTNLLPGPASSQLAILTAWRVGGTRGGLAGGLAFVLPGLVAMIGLAALFLAEAPPSWIRGAGAGAGAAVAAVAAHAGWGLLRPSWDRARAGRSADAGRWAAYVLLGTAATIVAGAWVVLVLVACGVVELVRRRARGAGGSRGADGGGGSRGADGDGGSPPGPDRPGTTDPGTRRGPTMRADAWPLIGALVSGGAGVGGLGALAWTSFKVGALSYGGGFVIIPLMRADAVDRHGWMTEARFLDAVALGQVTPGPVVHTVSAVGYAAYGVGGALFAATIAFAPSFVLILVLAPRFATLRSDERLRAFLDGAGPAAIGAILGAAVPLALSLTELWQAVVLVAAVAGLFVLRRGVVTTLLVAGCVGVAIALFGGPVPG